VHSNPHLFSWACGRVLSRAARTHRASRSRRAFRGGPNFVNLRHPKIVLFRASRDPCDLPSGLTAHRHVALIVATHPEYRRISVYTAHGCALVNTRCPPPPNLRRIKRHARPQLAPPRSWPPSPAPPPRKVTSPCPIPVSPMKKGFQHHWTRSTATGARWRGRLRWQRPADDGRMESRRRHHPWWHGPRG